MNSVNMLAEFVEVDAAHIDTPISHHGMERPERKKSFASLPALREQKMAIAARAQKKMPIAAQSHPLKTTVVVIYGGYFTIIEQHSIEINAQIIHNLHAIKAKIMAVLLVGLLHAEQHLQKNMN